VLDAAVAVDGIADTAAILEFDADDEPLLLHTGWRNRWDPPRPVPAGKRLQDRPTCIFGLTIQRFSSGNPPPENRAETEALAEEVRGACDKALAAVLAAGNGQGNSV